MVMKNDDVDCDELESLQIGKVNDSENENSFSLCFFHATSLILESLI